MQAREAISLEHSPWLPPLWEFQSRTSLFYERVHKVETPQGSFPFKSNNVTLATSLGLTFWPDWNAEIGLLMTKTSDINFSYEAAYTSIRYQWMDDLVGDPISLTTGLNLSFPRTAFLNNFSYNYHGQCNAEAHVSVGKEWGYTEGPLLNLWGLGGIGIAEKGSPWLHGLAVCDFAFNHCLRLGCFLEGIFGLGHNDIIPATIFPGYASIAHRSLDLGVFVETPLSYWGSLSFFGWGNFYAHNFIQHTWGMKTTLLIPFSF